MSKESLNPVETTIQFGDFVAAVKRKVPSSLKMSEMPSFAIGDRGIEERLREVWDKYGESYILEEPLAAYATTMYMLLNNMNGVEEGEQWLSLGSGPGIYEIFLAQKMARLKIVSLDLSPEQIKIQKKLLRAVARDNPVLESRVQPTVGSMTDLSGVGKDFKQVMCINALHWSPQWRRVVAEINGVLSPVEGARVYMVAGSTKFVGGGAAFAPDLTTDTIIEEFEKHGLKVTACGTLHIPGQFGLFTPRFYSVFERNSKVSGYWGDRIMKGKTTFTDYSYMGMGIIQISELNGKLRK